MSDTQLILILLIGVMSPTFAIEHYLKGMYGGKYRKAVIRLHNKFWLVVTVLTLFTVAYFQFESTWLKVGIGGLLLSRCFEVFYIFIKDSIDKISNEEVTHELFPYYMKVWSIVPKLYRKIKPANPEAENVRIKLFVYNNMNRDIKVQERLRHLLVSYIELLINYATIYLLLPVAYFNMPSGGVFEGWFHKMINFIYYSGVTITTLGYGDITPAHWFPQVVCVIEVVCGVIIIVFSFTVYVTLSIHNAMRKSR